MRLLIALGVRVTRLRDSGQSIGWVVGLGILATDPIEPDSAAADEEWFREPTRREHVIAAGLFVGFGAFFVVWFGVQSGWWFRWVILGLGLVSLYHGVRHGVDAMRMKRP